MAKRNQAGYRPRGQGKGDFPRNNQSAAFRSNYDGINWHRDEKPKQEPQKPEAK